MNKTLTVYNCNYGPALYVLDDLHDNDKRYITIKTTDVNAEWCIAQYLQHRIIYKISNVYYEAKLTRLTKYRTTSGIYTILLVLSEERKIQ